MTARSRRPGLGRLGPSGSTSAARAPFVLLVVVLLSGGLVTLLLLNSAINQGAFQLSKLQQQTKAYTDQEQQLQQDVDQESAPETLEQRARQLGMVPGGNPAFLSTDGKVRGVPAPPSSSATPQPGSAPANPAGGAASPNAAAEPSPLPSDAGLPTDAASGGATDQTGTQTGTQVGAQGGGTQDGTQSGALTGTQPGDQTSQTTTGQTTGR